MHIQLRSMCINTNTEAFLPNAQNGQALFPGKFPSVSHFYNAMLGYLLDITTSLPVSGYYLRI